MHKKFLRISTAIVIFSLSAHLLGISSAKAMIENDDQAIESWTKFRITWRGTNPEKSVKKVVLSGPLFENAKERVLSKKDTFPLLTKEKEILDVEFDSPKRWEYVKIEWNPPYTKLKSEDDWYTQQQNYYGYQREFAFKNPDSQGSLVYFINNTFPSTQFKRFPPIDFWNGCSSFGEIPTEKDDIVLYFEPGWNS